MNLIFDVALDSDIDLPELPEISNADTMIRIRKGIKNSDWLDRLSWQHHWYTENRSVCISLARCDDRYILRFPELVDFVITCSSATVEYYADLKFPPETIRHLLLDQVIPRMLGQQGRLVLHASAIELPESNKAIAFIGDSGWGKSTLASSFHQNGAKLLTDDCLLIEICDDKVSCIPNYYGVRLFEDSADAIFNGNNQSVQVAHYSEKKRLLIDHHDCMSDPVELDGIFLLEDPVNFGSATTISIKPIEGVEDFMRLIGQIFIIDVSEKNLYKNLFNNIKKIFSQGVPIYRLSYPHNYTMLPSVQKNVRDIIQKPHSLLEHRGLNEKKAF